MISFLYLILFIYFIFYNYYDKIFSLILYFSGFKLDKSNLNNIPSKIILISSHTSIYDFFIALSVYYTCFHNKYENYILMKKFFSDMCSPILPFLDKKFKIIEIDNKKKGITKYLIDNLKNKDNFIIFISPEGTRKIKEEPRKGYWALSKELNVKVIYTGVDFITKNISFEKARYVNNNWEDEKLLFIDSCKKYIPLYPERCYWTKNYYNSSEE